MGKPLIIVTSMGNMGPGQQRPESHKWLRSCPGPTTVEIVLPIICALVYILERPTDDGLEVAQGRSASGAAGGFEAARSSETRRISRRGTQPEPAETNKPNEDGREEERNKVGSFTHSFLAPEHQEHDSLQREFYY
jgi:hypothetical protein